MFVNFPRSSLEVVLIAGETQDLAWISQKILDRCKGDELPPLEVAQTIEEKFD